MLIVAAVTGDFSLLLCRSMRAAAITFWVVLFPENEGQMAAFGFVQHNFFVVNAAIGLLFWRRAQRSLWVLTFQST